jgi:restriction system protein
VAIDERRRAREDKRQELEDHLQEAEQRTSEAQSALKEMRSILAAGLRAKEPIDWSAMMKPPFSQPSPKQTPYLPLPIEPTFDPNQWKRGAGVVLGLIPYLAKRAEEHARRAFETAHTQWREREQAVERTNAKIYGDNLREYDDWKRREAAYEEARAQHNASIERARAAYQALNPDAILDYCDLVLSRSQYPDAFPRQYEIDYKADTKTLSIEYQVPSPDDLPRLESVKFSRSKGDFIEFERTRRDFEQLYGDVVFQIAIRTIHELFQADGVRALNAVIFSATVHTMNPGTGHEEDRCIATVRAERTVFEGLNLRNIESRACFESLGGIAGSRMLGCRAVKSLAKIDKTEQRFAAARDVTGERKSGLDEWQELTKILDDPQEIRFLPIGTLALLMGFAPQEKLSAALSKQLVKAVAARGYAVEPDVRYGAPNYRAEDEIALFRPVETSITDAYSGMAALLQFCVMVAAADDQPTEQELDVVREFLRRNTTLTRHEQQRLLVLESYLCRNPDIPKRSLSRLAKRLPATQRRLVGEVLVCVAGADSVISSAEWSALDRAFKALELPSGALDEILRKLGATFDEPTVQEAEPPLPGEAIPRTEPVAAPAPSFKLDMSRVEAISRETAQVIGLLSSVMSEDGQNPASMIQESPPPVVPIVNAPAWLKTLGSKYQGITARIVTKSQWSRMEFQQLATDFKLMPLGVVDALNEWADEQFGDFLLDGDDPVTVNMAILPKET